ADPSFQRPIRSLVERNNRDEIPLDDEILPEIAEALDGAKPVVRAYKIRNSNRTVATKIAGEVAYRYGSAGLPEGTIELHFAGTAVILGETGRSFGAGMTNGTAFVLDEAGGFERRHNAADVGIERIESEDDVEVLRAIVQRHGEATGSARAADVLARWEHYLP